MLVESINIEKEAFLETNNNHNDKNDNNNNTALISIDRLAELLTNTQLDMNTKNSIPSEISKTISYLSPSLQERFVDRLADIIGNKLLINNNNENEKSVAVKTESAQQFTNAPLLGGYTTSGFPTPEEYHAMYTCASACITRAAVMGTCATQPVVDQQSSSITAINTTTNLTTNNVGNIAMNMNTTKPTKPALNTNMNSVTNQRPCNPHCSCFYCKIPAGPRSHLGTSAPAIAYPLASAAIGALLNTHMSSINKKKHNLETSENMT
jgi:hypothetical protein